MVCLDGMTVTLTADAVETDDLNQDESEGSLPINVLPTPVVYQAVLPEELNGGNAVTPSGSVTGLLGWMMDGPLVYGECPSGESDANEVPQNPEYRSEILPDSRSPLQPEAGENSTQGSACSCPLQEVRRLPTDCDRMFPREGFFLPENSVRGPTRPLPPKLRCPTFILRSRRFISASHPVLPHDRCSNLPSKFTRY
jgi:hypothetical protein